MYALRNSRHQRGNQSHQQLTTEHPTNLRMHVSPSPKHGKSNRVLYKNQTADVKKVSLTLLPRMGCEQNAAPHQ
jgi:hypothetical protein